MYVSYNKLTKQYLSKAQTSDDENVRKLLIQISEKLDDAWDNFLDSPLFQACTIMDMRYSEYYLKTMDKTDIEYGMEGLKYHSINLFKKLNINWKDYTKSKINHNIINDENDNFLCDIDSIIPDLTFDDSLFDKKDKKSKKNKKKVTKRISKSDNSNNDKDDIDIINNNNNNDNNNKNDNINISNISNKSTISRKRHRWEIPLLDNNDNLIKKAKLMNKSKMNNNNNSIEDSSSSDDYDEPLFIPESENNIFDQLLLPIIHQMHSMSPHLLYILSFYIYI